MIKLAKDIMTCFGFGLAFLGGIFGIVALVLLQLAPWLLAAYVLVCLLTGTPIMSPRYEL